MNTTQQHPDILKDVMSAAWQVRREYGPGLPESAYEFALVNELRRRGLQAERKQVDNGSNVTVNDCLLLALRCVDRITSMHSKQLTGYLRKLRFRQGLLLNFNETFIRQGVHPVSL